MAVPKINFGYPQRRDAVRVAIDRYDILLWTTHETHSKAHMGMLVNLSASGALVESTHIYAASAPMRCTFSLPGVGHFSVPATVVRCLPEETERARHKIALRFRADRSSEDRMVRWIFHKLARQRVDTQPP